MALWSLGWEATYAVMVQRRKRIHTHVQLYTEAFHFAFFPADLVNAFKTSRPALAGRCERRAAVAGPGLLEIESSRGGVTTEKDVPLRDAAASRSAVPRRKLGGPIKNSSSLSLPTSEPKVPAVLPS